MPLIKSLSIILIIAYFILFSGCSRVINWGNRTFYQGCKKDICSIENSRKYIRSIKVYDQFATLGIFDALLITPEVLQAYLDLHKEKFVLTEHQAKSIYEDEYAEKIEKYISFFVLAFEPMRFISPLYIPEQFEEAPWVITMQVSGKIYIPCKIEMVCLETEYKIIFGKYFSNFKKAYFVQFPKVGNSDCSKSISLSFTCFSNRVELRW